MVTSYVLGIRGLAGVSTIFGFVFLSVSAWVMSMLLQNDGGIAKEIIVEDPLLTEEIKNLTMKINDIWETYEPFLLGFTVVESVCATIQILISIITLFASGSNVREGSATWKCTHLILLAAVLFCFLGPFSFDFMKSALPSLYELGDRYHELTGASLEISPNLLTIYYVVLGVNNIVLFILAGLTCTFMRVCSDYNYESTLTDFAMEERRMSIISAHR